MFIRPARDIPPSEITSRSVYLRRREFMLGATALAIAGRGPPRAASLQAASGPFSTDEKPTQLESIRGYTNFQEFGSRKSDPAAYADRLTTSPWKIKIDGLVARPADYDLDDLIKDIALEERIYRLRCVEGWSMVIPWIGVPLGSVLERVEPTGSARFVSFQTLLRPSEMPAQKRFLQTLSWPYMEGLRLDEAMHSLTILAVGMYGERLPNENGAPIRLVVPWKYGFKSIKSIVRIRLTEAKPATSWNLLSPDEYGFYANVNPKVDHPRWSQAKERRIESNNDSLLTKRRPTLPFNGYGDQVASLYAGMDLKTDF